jgi:hypothetical protein
MSDESPGNKPLFANFWFIPIFVFLASIAILGTYFLLGIFLKNEYISLKSESKQIVNVPIFNELLVALNKNESQFLNERGIFKKLTNYPDGDPCNAGLVFLLNF